MNTVLPPILQSIGVSCVPNPNVGTGAPGWLRQTPVAAAILTMRRTDPGRCEVSAAMMSDARAQEFPLAWLVDQALEPEAATLLGANDARTLFMLAASRRFFAEPSLATVLYDPHRITDVCATAGSGPEAVRAFAAHLAIPTLDNGISDNQRLWDKRCVGPLEERALAAATSQLMIWSTLAAAQHSEPDLFFQPMLALRAWLDKQPETSALRRWTTSRPLMRAVSYERDFRADRTRRAAGQPRVWPRFEDGLFHT